MATDGTTTASRVCILQRPQLKANYVTTLRKGCPNSKAPPNAAFFSLVLEDTPPQSKQTKEMMATSSGADLTFKWSKQRASSLCSQGKTLHHSWMENSSGNSRPAGEGRAQQARNKWGHLKNQYKVAAGLLISRYRRGGQWEANGSWFVLMDEVLGPSTAPCPNCHHLRTHQGQVTRRRASQGREGRGGGRMKEDVRLQRGWRDSSFCFRGQSLHYFCCYLVNL
ncbi:uncharacterized protein LOC119033462 isoform X1 [Acanthopagrus latus]|uniref:uncharacterized protein LOC119033462 isoform X1 n=1 Tax=Acanthopagrus latus TaxID=8177 RepID=UPI00187C2ADC|nr:uncharacterized protein LOC119033462 isoform X1 [Acanthopagrus latus]